MAAGFGASVAGALSSMLTVILLFVFDRFLEFDLFSILIWGIFPLGALGAGLMAASGYYLGAVWLGARPTRRVALGMLAVTALTQVGLYYAHYYNLQTADHVPIRKVMEFPQFVGLLLTHLRYGPIGHGGTGGVGVEVGVLGYAIAAIQFIGLQIGGVITYALLLWRPYCTRCHRYVRKVGQWEIRLGKQDWQDRLQQLRATQPLSEDYFALSVPTGDLSPARVDVRALQCRDCKRFVVREEPKLVGRGGEWNSVSDLDRTKWLEAGAPVAPRVLG